MHICGALGGAWRSFLLLEYFVAEVQDLVLGTVDDDAAAIFLDDDLAVLQLRLRLVVVGFPPGLPF